MNKLIKKVLVGITAATMMFGSVCTAYAATDSATVAPAPEKQTNVKADNGAKVSTTANGTATVKALPKTTKKSVTVASKVVVWSLLQGYSNWSKGFCKCYKSYNCYTSSQHQDHWRSGIYRCKVCKDNRHQVCFRKGCQDCI